MEQLYLDEKKKIELLENFDLEKAKKIELSEYLDYPIVELEKILKAKNRKIDELIEKAYYFSCIAHNGQKRKSGEPYFIHPFEVAKILASLSFDSVTIASGFLHDTVEDIDFIDKNLIEKVFNKEVALIVEGVTKLGKLKFYSKLERQAESIRKMLIAMVKDIRVVVVKLADRLHNMKTLEAMPYEKRLKKAKETLEIYAPLAHRLGMYRLQCELEDLAFKYLYPEEYEKLSKELEEFERAKEEVISYAIGKIKSSLRKLQISANVQYRKKHLYSIYRKLKDKKKELEDIYDILGIRIITNTVEECYTILGLIHTLFTPIPGRFKDYIAMPKNNGYQSLHTSVLVKYAQKAVPLEFQIRTWQMHKIAEEGIAAHYLYKEKDSDKNIQRIKWLRQLLEWHKDMQNNNAVEYVENLKNDLFSQEVFVFTPSGDVVELPVGATALDFAYYIHTEVGNHCKMVKINGNIANLDTKLNTGDIVEVITNNAVTPTKNWLDWVKTSRARSKIKSFLKQKQRDLFYEKGLLVLINTLKEYQVKLKKVPKEILDQYGICLLDEKILNKDNIKKMALLEKAAGILNYRDMDDLIVAVGSGELKVKKIIEIIFPAWIEVLSKVDISQKDIVKEKEAKLLIGGQSHIAYKLAKCCCPVPGDEIIGVITKKGFINVHRVNCKNLETILDEKKIQVSWGHVPKYAKFETNLRIVARDRENLLLDITTLLSKFKINITNINARTMGNLAILELRLMVRNLEQLEKIISAIRGLKSIQEVKRI